MLAESVLNFGKHEGKTFADVASLDPEYCQWAQKAGKNSDGPLKQFASFLDSKCSPHYSSSSPSGARCKPSGHTNSTPNNSKIRPKRDAEESNDTKQSQDSPFSEFAYRPKKERKLPLSLQGASIGGSSPRKRGKPSSATPSDSIVQRDRASPIFLDCGALALELVSDGAYRLLAVTTVRGRQVMSPYLPKALYSEVIRTAEISPSRDSPLLLPAVSYRKVVDMLQDRCQVDVSRIPDFVLLSFDGFRTFAAPQRMAKKCAVIFTGEQTPRTLSKASEILTLIGDTLQAGLRPFQVSGVEFGLSRNGRCLVGDEMGLGKTLQALAIAAVYRSEWPVLVVCPSSIIFQWRDQSKRWLGHLLNDPEREVFVVKNGKSAVPDSALIVLISYDLLSKNTSFQTAYQVIICDESHYLKSSVSKRTLSIVPLLQQARRALLLSGTPALNRPSDLYQQLSALLPKFTSYQDFSTRYCETKFNPWSKKPDYTGGRHEDELFRFLTKTVMIRRLKKDVQKELPPKLRSLIPIEISTADRKQIGEAMSALTDGLQQNASMEDVMRIAANSGGEESTEAPRDTRRLISELFVMTGKAKIKGCCEYISYLLQLDCKFLVFAHHKIVLDSLETQLIKEKVEYIRIDGSVPAAKREIHIKQFQEKPSCRVAVLSITACGHGLNLTASGTVVFAELYWVPGQMLQAEDRCHRIGTTFSTIQVHYLHAEGTVDELVWKTLNKKWSAITNSLNGKVECIEAKHCTQGQAASSSMSPAVVNPISSAGGHLRKLSAAAKIGCSLQTRLSFMPTGSAQGKSMLCLDGGHRATETVSLENDYPEDNSAITVGNSIDDLTSEETKETPQTTRVVLPGRHDTKSAVAQQSVNSLIECSNKDTVESGFVKKTDDPLPKRRRVQEIRPRVELDMFGPPSPIVKKLGTTAQASSKAESSASAVSNVVDSCQNSVLDWNVSDEDLLSFFSSDV
eukprot:Lankesteria_metandrocarpae@DN4900_c0_g1_i3.p1